MRWLSGKENGKPWATHDRQAAASITSLEIVTFRIVYSSIRCCRVVAYDLGSDATGSRGGLKVGMKQKRRRGGDERKVNGLSRST